MSTLVDTLDEIGWCGDVAPGKVDLPEGWYDGRVVDWKVRQVGEHNTPVLMLTLEVTDGDCKGGRIDRPLWLTVKSLPYVARDLKALGREIKKASDVLSLTFDDLPVRFRVAKKKDADKNEVSWIGPRAVETKGATPDQANKVSDLPF